MSSNITIVQQKSISKLLKLFQHFGYLYNQTQLQPYSYQALEKIVKSTIQIEKYTSGQSSYMMNFTKEPLLKYLNKLTSTSFTFFLKSENINEYGKFLISLLVHGFASNDRKWTRDSRCGNVSPEKRTPFWCRFSAPRAASR